jgi:hypothetical protein
MQAVPRWVAWTLVVAAVLLLAWAYFISGFLSEPSATGRSRLVLDWLIGSSIGSAAACVIAAAGLLRSARWGRAAALFASAVMIVTCAGAVIGIPTLIGLIPSRRSS